VIYTLMIIGWLVVCIAVLWADIRRALFGTKEETRL
jgi:hypothetical protein